MNYFHILFIILIGLLPNSFLCSEGPSQDFPTHKKPPLIGSPISTTYDQRDMWQKNQALIWVYEKTGKKIGQKITHWTKITQDESKQESDNQSCFPIATAPHETNSDKPSQFLPYFEQKCSNGHLEQIMSELKQLTHQSNWNSRFDHSLMDLESLRQTFDDQDTIKNAQKGIAATLKELRTNVKEQHRKRVQARLARFNAAQTANLETFKAQQDLQRQHFNKQQQEDKAKFSEWETQSSNQLAQLDPTTRSWTRTLWSESN